MARRRYIKLPEVFNNRVLSVLVFSLFFSWLLSFAFEGQVLYSLAGIYGSDVKSVVFSTIAAHFAGLLMCCFFVKSPKAARLLMRGSITVCISGSMVYFFPPSILWGISLPVMSFLAGACVAAWSFFLKIGTPKNKRIKTVADGLIYTNILMIIINTIAINLSPFAGLSLAMLMLLSALFFSGYLPGKDQPNANYIETERRTTMKPVKPLVLLCIFIIIITVNSGLMFQVVNPSYQHHQWLVSWYWSVPYVVALFIMRNLPLKINKGYLLYVAIAMMGFAFIFFMIFDRSVASYLAVDTLMLGACGVYDLFWWSILGEMIEYGKNPAKIFGAGLSANVLGVLIGGMLGSAVTKAGNQEFDSSLIAIAVIFCVVIILPLLHKQLSLLLKNHAYLNALSKMSPAEQMKEIESIEFAGQLTRREIEITELLLKGRTYRMIAGELYLSENTIKTHVKNIYSKLNIQSKIELINLMIEKSSNISK